MSREKVVVVPTPTQVLHAIRNGVDVSFMLYGEVTPERIAKERTELARRLDQLQPVPRPTDADDYKSFRRSERFFRDEDLPEEERRQPRRRVTRPKLALEE